MTAEHHPSADRLAALADGELSGPEQEALSQHVADCADCAQAMRLALSLSDDAQSFSAAWAGEPDFAPVSVQSTNWLRPMALAASVVVAVSAAYFFFDESMQPEASQVRGIAMAVEPPDGSKLTSPPSQFSWASTESARFTLTNSQAVIIHQSETEDGLVELPAPLLAELANGGTFYWTVDLPKSALGPYTLIVE